MPLQPLEDENDTVINFVYPLEPPVRFLTYFSEECYLIVSNRYVRFGLFENFPLLCAVTINLLTASLWFPLNNFISWSFQHCAS